MTTLEHCDSVVKYISELFRKILLTSVHLRSKLHITVTVFENYCHSDRCGGDEVAQSSRPDLTQPELQVKGALKKLAKKYGKKKPPLDEVAEKSGYSVSRVSELMKLLAAKGATRERFEVVA
jgi:hypothetical protein